MSRIPTHVGLALTAALAAAPARASVPDLFGYGARGVGLAGAVVSTASGHEAVYYNPAGLAFSERPSFALGWLLADPHLTIDGADVQARTAPAALIGFDFPIPLGGPLAHRLTLGHGFVIPQDSVLRADVKRPGAPSFVLLENRAQTVTLQVALGARLTDGLAIGAGFLALAELEGEVAVAPNAAGRIGSRVSDELLADYALVAGVQWRLEGGAALGVAYRGESRAVFSLPITADLGPDFPLPVPPLAIEGTAQYDPRQVAAEVSGTPVGPVRVAAGFTWKQWSRFRNPIAFTAVPADHPAQPAPGFHDTYVWRLGLEGTLDVGAGLTVRPRLAYAFEPTPVPAQEGLHTYLDNDRHVLGAGCGVSWDALRFELGAQWHALTARSETKDAARLAPFGLEPPRDPTLRHGGRVLVLGAEIGVRL